MSVSYRIAAGALAGAGALVATLPAAEAQPAPRHGDSCFYVSNIQNTKMQGLRTLYIRTSQKRVYRMEFGADCNTVGYEPLILHPVDNSNQVCSPIGLNVSVRGTGEMCVPTSLTRLTPAEVAAIPPKFRP